MFYTAPTLESLSERIRTIKRLVYKEAEGRLWGVLLLQIG